MKTPELRELLSRHGLHLSRELGQNFLTDEDLAADLARRAGASAGDLVIEVGTGLGVLIAFSFTQRITVDNEKFYQISLLLK